MIPRRLRRARVAWGPARRPGVAALGALLAALLAPGARADDPPVPAAVPAAVPEAAEDLRAELLACRSDGEWRGVLEARLLPREPALIGRVLGPLLSDRERYAEHLPCVAYVAAFLADHPVNGGREILLAGSILERIRGDEAFLEAFRGHLTAVQGVRPGFDLLVDHARRSLAPSSDADAAERAAALWFLGRSPTQATLELLHRLGREGLGTDGAGDPPGPLVAEWLDALAGVLSYRFPDAGAALAFLDAHEGESREAMLSALLRRGTPEAERDRANAIAWGRRLVARAETPEQLEEFVDAARTPYLEIRREAVRRAGQLAPKADEAWSRFLCTVLDREADDEALRGALQILERTTFRDAPDLAGGLSRCVSARLRRSPASVPVADRVRLARLLGRLGKAPAVLEAVQWARGAAPPVETEVLVEVIRATGQVDGISPEVGLQFYRAHPSEDARDRKVREAVADALGLPGAAGPGTTDLAGAALRAMITGEGPPDLLRETAPEVRAMAIQRLQNHPGPATSDVLRVLAGGADEAEAKAALVVLGVSLRAPSAAQALAAIARSAGPEERRRSALRDLARLDADAAGEVLPEVRAAVRDVIASADAPEPLRREALVTAAALADEDALDAALDLHARAPADEELGAMLRALFQAVAEAGDGNDAALDAALATLASRGAHDLAIDTARALAEATGRPALLVARARVLKLRAEVESHPREERRRDLEEADAFLAAALGTAGPAAREAATLLHVRVLESLAALVPSDEGRREVLLRAVERAATGSGRALAEEGIRLAQGLEEQGRDPPLAEGQRQRLRAAREALDRMVRPPPG